MTPTSQACEHRWIWHLASDNRSPSVGICQDCGAPNFEHIAAWAEDRIKTATCDADAELETMRGKRDTWVAEAGRLNDRLGELVRELVTLRGTREATFAAIEDAVHALDIDNLAAYDVERIARVACAQFRTDDAERLRAELEKMRGKRDAWRAEAGRLRGAGPCMDTAPTVAEFGPQTSCTLTAGHAGGHEDGKGWCWTSGLPADDAPPRGEAEWLLRGEVDDAQRQMRLALGSAASMAEQIIQRDLRLEVIARAETVALSERDQARALLVRALDLIDETSDYDYKAADAIRREAGLS